MEKIVSGMFLRRTDFQDLQRMVVSCIAEGDGEIALATERRKIAAWPEHYGAYTRAMAEAPRVAEVLEREARLVAVEAEPGRIHARVLRLLAHLEDAITANRRERARLADQAGAEEQAQRRVAEGIRIRLEVAGREARDQEGRVAALDQQQADWQRCDLPAKAALLLREPELSAELAQLERRREAVDTEGGWYRSLHPLSERWALLRSGRRVVVVGEEPAADAQVGEGGGGVPGPSRPVDPFDLVPRRVWLGGRFR